MNSVFTEEHLRRRVLHVHAEAAPVVSAENYYRGDLHLSIPSSHPDRTIVAVIHHCSIA